jgi:hypothetical protein
VVGFEEGVVWYVGVRIVNGIAIENLWLTVHRGLTA